MMMIWSADDELIGDDRPLSMQKRNSLIIHRSPQITTNSNYSDSQSILSTESHTSQQEVMPADIRKRLSEVKKTGPILFDVKIKFCFFEIFFFKKYIFCYSIA